MIAAKIPNFVFTFLILIEIVIALDSDGICTYVQEYYESCGTLESCGIKDPKYRKTRIVRQCCPGYKSIAKNCIPVCAKECSNGNCTRPNYCTCDPGYKKSGNLYRCDPVCSEPCLNGTCSEPEVCTCLSGFHKNVYGICIENECDASINDATSMSEKCGNGTCTSNGVCVCHMGFVKNEESNQCEPFCDETCVNSNCTSPNYCTCDPGHKKSSNLYRCDPVCSEPCLNGTCSVPGVCNCLSGFHKIADGICIEDECDASLNDATSMNKKCRNGNCTSNGVCVCDMGFVKNEESNQCEPFCDETCVNSNCTSPNYCTCDPGYKKSSNLYRCDPVCSEPCLNGTCSVPGVCNCLSGFHKIADGICIEDECDASLNDATSMNKKCRNGNCTSNGVCVCDMGFVKNEESNQCEPFCNETCVNSNCTSPNICTCNKGFSPFNATHCEILCENCNHGYCEEPNLCQCDVGYHKNIEKELCVQNQCTSDIMDDSCENGHCLDGICVCNSGYEKNTSTACTPHCSLECVNGYCSEPEVCQCLNGFEFKTSNDSDNGNNCTNCAILTNDKIICHPILSSDRVHCGYTYFWIVVAAVFVIILCVSIFVYVRYIKEHSYNLLDSKVIYYENEVDMDHMDAETSPDTSSMTIKLISS